MHAVVLSVFHTLLHSCEYPVPLTMEDEEDDDDNDDDDDDDDDADDDGGGC